MTALRRLSGFAQAAGQDLLAAQAMGAAAAAADQPPPATGVLVEGMRSHVLAGHAAGAALVAADHDPADPTG